VKGKDGKGTTPLHLAIIYQPDAIPILLENGADVNAALDDGLIPLHIAAMYQPNAIPLLIRFGANVNAADNNGRTPLHVAAQHHPNAIPTLLENGANVNAQSKYRLTPLHVASHYQPDAIPILIQNGANVNAQSEAGLTPLHYIIKFGKPPEVGVILIEAGADINALDTAGNRPIDYCRTDECWSIFGKYYWRQRVQAMKRVISGKRYGSETPLPQLPTDVWEYILHKKKHKELCQNLQDEDVRGLLLLAEKMRLPREMIAEWGEDVNGDITKEVICEKLAKILSIGAFYSEKGMDFLRRRDRAQEGLSSAKHFLDTLKEFGISTEGKSIAKLLDELNMIYRNVN
jgi:hypothetical protein